MDERKQSRWKMGGREGITSDDILTLTGCSQLSQAKAGWLLRPPCAALLGSGKIPYDAWPLCRRRWPPGSAAWLHLRAHLIVTRGSTNTLLIRRTHVWLTVHELVTHFVKYQKMFGPVLHDFSLASAYWNIKYHDENQLFVGARLKHTFLFFFFVFFFFTATLIKKKPDDD